MKNLSLFHEYRTVSKKRVDSFESICKKVDLVGIVLQGWIFHKIVLNTGSVQPFFSVIVIRDKETMYWRRGMRFKR